MKFLHNYMDMVEYKGKTYPLLKGFDTKIETRSQKDDKVLLKTINFVRIKVESEKNTM